MSAWQIAIDFIRRLDYNEIHPDSRKDLTQTMKLVCLVSALLLALFFVLPAAGESEFYTEMPPCLRFSQETVQETIEENMHILRTYPDTANDLVDAQMHALIDAMAQANRALLSPPEGDVPSYLDVGAIVSRTGTSVLSFLTLAEVTKDMEHLSVDFCTRVYDIQTGEQLSLSRFFAPDSGAWAILASAVRSQLSAAFPGMEPDRAALDQLCSAESLREAAFTLGAARLTLTYRADMLYPGTNTLLHVHIPYPDIREMMTDYGKAQTDNSRFKMLALTYDDGPARGTTRKLLESLRRHGAQATFFIVGKNISRNHDILSLQQNRSYSIQSHSYTHTYPKDLNPGAAFEEDARLRRELSALVGVEPTMMRAPGGTDAYYTGQQIGYPLINWSAPSGDSGNDDIKGIIRALKNRAADGAIVLMHDIHAKCSIYTEEFLKNLESRGYLCVTVDELFCDAGVPLMPNVSYFSPYRIAE